LGTARRFPLVKHEPRCTCRKTENVRKYAEEPHCDEHWKSEPEAHDFPAAADYLSLVFAEDAAAAMVEALRAVPLSHRKAKDLLRAGQLPLLDTDSAHVAKDLGKIKSGDRLSPVLLVRGDAGGSVPLVVADGYHRICASYHLDENADIPCRIVSASKI
jgi:hypothetical protein